MEYLLAVCLLILWLQLRARLTELESRIALRERWDRAPAPPQPIVRPTSTPPPVPVTPPPPPPAAAASPDLRPQTPAPPFTSPAAAAPSGARPRDDGHEFAAPAAAAPSDARPRDAGREFAAPAAAAPSGARPRDAGHEFAAPGAAARPTRAPQAYGPQFATPSSRDWESTVGGNWLNKLGVVILVIGIALALGYSFTRVGPGGRVAISLAASFTMLGAGIALQSRYRVFANGLLAGGWAALYFTTYAMHAVEAARVVDNPYTAGVLLFAVSSAMIGHSLRYRSESVTGLAYGIAFATLAIAEPNAFAVPALLPLVASLLYVARRFEWRRIALLGVIGAYGVIALRGDSGSPLWQIQALLATFWLLFEAFDILSDGWLLGLNGAGFLGLSILAWQHRSPDEVWRLAAGSAVAYLVSAILRRRSDWWPAAAAVSAALAAAAIFLRGEGQWTTFSLLLEAEAVYFAGVRLRLPFLRYLATVVFVLALAQLAAGGGNWVPAAAIAAGMFYANAFVDRFHGYAGSVLLTAIVGHEAPQDRGLVWMGLAAVTFAIGWLGRRFDLRLQGYGLGMLAFAMQVALGPLLSSLAYTEFATQVASWWALGLSAGVFYAGALCGRFSSRIGGREAEIFRFASSVATCVLGASAVWHAVPVKWTGISCVALGAVLLELGVRDLPSDLRRLGLALAGMGAIVAAMQILMYSYQGGWELRMMPLLAAAIATSITIRAPETTAVASFAASGYLAAAAWTLLPAASVAPAWAALALARSRHRETYPLAAAAFLRSSDPTAVIWGAAAVVLLLHGIRRTWASLAGSALLAILLYHHVSGSVLTIAWGAEGIALLAAGFPLADRVLRLSGLYVLLFCILKLFVYDLRYLDTLPRIFSFIVLGVILVAVSWLYARRRAAR